MECPKCHKSVDDDDIFCPNCDTRLRPDKNTSIMKRFKKQNKPLNVEIVGEKKHKLSESKLKLISYNSGGSAPCGACRPYRCEYYKRKG